MRRSVVSIIAFLSFVSAASSLMLAQSAPPKPVASPAAAKTSSGSVININTATVAELDSLPGIGTKTAARIVEYRQKNGAFKKVEELMNVRGVGEKNFLKLKSQISVGAAKTDHERPNP